MLDIESRIAEKIAQNQAITIEEAEQFIITVPSRSDTTIFIGEDGLQRSYTFLELLGNPQNTNKTIHIAGTSGKGSVATLITNLLVAHGKQVGTYSSPHVYNLRERWQFNGALVDDELPKIIPKLYAAIVAMEQTPWGRPTYFEITTAIGFMLFANKVEYNVIETGMGGLYDTTNTVNRSDKLAVITELGLDHTHILGNTLAEIAQQKAGILPAEGSAIILKPEDSQALQAIEATATERHTTVQFIEPTDYSVQSITLDSTTFAYYGSTLKLEDCIVSLIGEHQVKNTAIALRVLEFLSQRDGFVIDDAAARHTLANTSLPGRFEQKTLHGKPFIFDGAHNPQKLGALANILQSALPNQKLTWVMALGKNKDALESFKLIAPLIDTLYVTSFFADQDMPLSSKATEPTELAETARQAGITTIVIEPNNATALAQAAKTAHTTPIIVAGSFYLLGDIS